MIEKIVHDAWISKKYVVVHESQIRRKGVLFKGAQVWDFDVLDFYDFFIMKSI
jgi:hypothetical protein